MGNALISIVVSLSNSERNQGSTNCSEVPLCRISSWSSVSDLRGTMKFKEHSRSTGEWMDSCPLFPTQSELWNTGTVEPERRCDKRLAPYRRQISWGPGLHAWSRICDQIPMRSNGQAQHFNLVNFAVLETETPCP